MGRPIAGVKDVHVLHQHTQHQELIALSTQGLSGVQRFVVGSVADKLLRTAPMPLLVLP